MSRFYLTGRDHSALAEIRRKIGQGSYEEVRAKIPSLSGDAAKVAEKELEEDFERRLGLVERRLSLGEGDSAFEIFILVAREFSIRKGRWAFDSKYRDWMRFVLPRFEGWKKRNKIPDEVGLESLKEFVFAKSWIEKGVYGRAITESRGLPDKTANAVVAEVRAAIRGKIDRIEYLFKQGLFDDASDEIEDLEVRGVPAELEKESEKIQGFLEKLPIFKANVDVAREFSQIDRAHPKWIKSAERSSQIDSDDLRLICYWSNIDLARDHHLGLSDVRTALGDYEFYRLISARHAEKVAHQFLVDMYGECRDVSIQQTSGFRGAWENYDLCSNGLLFDVKNARRNFKDDNRFSELCVPQFKKERSLQESAEVKILGVLSDYQTADQIDAGQLGSALVLGTAAESEIATCQQVANEFFGSVIEFNFQSEAMSRGVALPGWLFRYPEKFYEGELDKLLEAYHRFSPIASDKALPFKVAPLALRIACLDSGSKVHIPAHREHPFWSNVNTDSDST